ncbi:hypothetical protein D3C87_1835980 [compost metagenome]
MGKRTMLRDGGLAVEGISFRIVAPTPALILNSHQAEAVYSAMCALNNVSGKIECEIDGCIKVIERSNGNIDVSSTKQFSEEYYDDQGAFRDAYGLDA